MDTNIPAHPISNKRHFQITGQRLILRPYARRFVDQYHGWFVDEELLYLTGSEPLSLQEEYENQQSWLTDPLKYTFLIFTKGEGEDGVLVGDINLFFSKWIEPNQAEINIMIARRDHRGKGLAREALTLVEAFARVQYDRNEIIAKIKDDNAASMRLF